MQVNDVVFMRHGTEFFTSTDLATRDSADRNIMAWDFATGAVLSNQIYHVSYQILINNHMLVIKL